MNITVIMGGPSAENEISILSGIEVCKHLLNRNPYRVRAVLFTHDKTFYYGDISEALPQNHDFFNPQDSSAFQGPYTPQDSAAIWKGCDLVFPALHGAYGEDGKIQGYLDILGIAYVGSGVGASSIAMNKVASKYIFLQNGLHTPPFSLYTRNDCRDTIDAIAKKHGFPCFVKCPHSGSSKLMGRADTETDLNRLIDALIKEADEILIETFIQGVEFTCPVLEYPDGRVAALEPIEIQPVSSTFFDYEAKYKPEACKELVPCSRPAPLLNRIQQLARKAHTLLGCRGISRTDMIFHNDILYVLETNSIPGLTSGSLVPKSFIAGGGTYEEMIDILIQTARQQHATGQ